MEDNKRDKQAKEINDILDFTSRNTADDLLEGLQNKEYKKALKAQAVWIYSMYEEYKKAGFDESQAMTLAVNHMSRS